MITRHAVIIGLKNGKPKVIGEAKDYETALGELMQFNDDASLFKGHDEVTLAVCERDGVNPVIARHVVESRQKENGELAEAEAVRPKIKAKAALVGLIATLFAFSATAQQNILPNLASTTLNGTNAANGQALQWNPGDVFTVEAVVTTTYNATADTNDIVMTIDESLGGQYWTAATQTKTIDCGSTTNGSVTLFSLTNSLGTKWWRVTQVERPDNGGTNTVTFNQLLLLKQ